MDKRTIEGIESCRPGSDDLRQLDLSDVARQVELDAEARACFERTQLWDAKVADAMQRVEAPVGLAARLLAALASSEPSGASPAFASRLPGFVEALKPESAASDHPTQVRRRDEMAPARWSRRQWIGTLTTVAAALVLSLVLNSVLRTDESEPLENMAGAWQKALGSDWRDMRQAPRGFSLPDGLVGTPTGWQWIDKQMQVKGVAYQLKDAQGATATLYVVQLDRPDEPTTPPGHPQSTSVWAVGYWRDGKNVCVLVTRDEATYRRFINPSPAPLA